MKKYLIPDAPTPGSGGGKKPRKTNIEPNKDADLKNLFHNVTTTWEATPEIKLLWITPAELRANVTSFNNELSTRLSVGGDRPSQTFNLKTLDSLCVEGLRETKVYIQKLFKTTGAEAQYPRYGLIKLKNGSWNLPTDRNKRSEALELTVAAIEKDGFAGEEYGLTFWTDLQNGYSLGIKNANATDGSVSTKVASKNELKKLIKKALKSLRYVIEANYPDTYQAELRRWGWQKEDY